MSGPGLRQGLGQVTGVCWSLSHRLPFASLTGRPDPRRSPRHGVPRPEQVQLREQGKSRVGGCHACAQRLRSTKASLACSVPQYGARALSRVLATIMGQTDNRVPLPQGYPGGDAAFFRGEPGLLSVPERCGDYSGAAFIRIWGLNMAGFLGRGQGSVLGSQGQRQVFLCRHEAGPAVCGHRQPGVALRQLGCGEG